MNPVFFSAPTGRVNLFLHQESPLSNQFSKPEGGFDWMGPCLVRILRKIDGTFKSGTWKEYFKKGYLQKPEQRRGKNKSKGRT